MKKKKKKPSPKKEVARPASKKQRPKKHIEAKIPELLPIPSEQVLITNEVPPENINVQEDIYPPDLVDELKENPTEQAEVIVHLEATILADDFLGGLDNKQFNASKRASFLKRFFSAFKK